LRGTVVGPVAAGLAGG